MLQYCCTVDSLFQTETEKLRFTTILWKALDANLADKLEKLLFSKV